MNTLIFFKISLELHFQLKCIIPKSIIYFPSYQVLSFILPKLQNGLVTSKDTQDNSLLVRTSRWGNKRKHHDEKKRVFIFF